jgi:hypothetical protein
VLVQAELMWREGEDVPRVTMKGFTLLSDMAKRARGRLVVALNDVGDVETLAELVAASKGKGRGELVASVATAAGVARVWIGRDYLLDAETMAQVARAFGADRVMARRSIRRGWRWSVRARASGGWGRGPQTPFVPGSHLSIGVWGQRPEPPEASYRRQPSIPSLRTTRARRSMRLA